MPKLQIVAACEKVIFDQDGPVSIISLFQRMRVQLQAAPLPEKALSPTLWSIFTLWENDPKDVGTEFIQVVKVIAPDGAIFTVHEGPFTNTDVSSRQTKTRTQLPGLPIWAEGEVRVEVSLKGSETVLGTYAFEIEYMHPFETVTEHLQRPV